MSDSAILGSFAAPHRIEHKGIVYEMRCIDQVVKTAFEKAFFDRAIATAQSLASAKGERWLADKLAQMADEYMSGKFSVYSKAGIAFLETNAGMQTLLSLLTGRDFGEIVGLLIDKKDEVMLKLQLVLKESFPGVKMEPPDPNASPPPTEKVVRGLFPQTDVAK